jgi:hypothetical protein
MGGCRGRHDNSVESLSDGGFHGVVDGAGPAQQRTSDAWGVALKQRHKWDANPAAPDRETCDRGQEVKD